ncbi:MAG: hypothetical protein KDC87_22200, partial [Planctomycetes bacterium]|nr:hypothetical protein [Planctomycetota bacterium]
LEFEVRPRQTYVITVVRGGDTRVLTRRLDEGREELVEVEFPGPGGPIETAAAKWFAAGAGARPEFPAALDAQLAADEAAAREAVWRAYRVAPIHAGRRQDFAHRKVRSGKHESPYAVRWIGQRPKNGWPLFIAMHGGGGVEKRVNDSQWYHMQSYYRAHSEVGGYCYVALRAPNDRWNGFYDHYVWPLITELIRQFTVCGDVDPSRVFALGYSHGGYGAFAIAANIPDRFAAVHASAAAPTPGITPAENFRALKFSFMIGGRDRAYGRADRCKQFAAAIDKLRDRRSDVFDVTMELEPSRGHGGLPDRDKVRALYPAVRRPAPREITWHTTGTTVSDFYWLHLPEPAKGYRIAASCRDNVITLTTHGADALQLGLDARLVDFGKPIVLKRNGQTTRHTLKPSLATLCRSMLRRGDRDLAHTALLR